jgi:hypothetical protein
VFVDLEAEEADSGIGRRTGRKNIAARIIDAFQSNEKNFFFVIGDFGTGKTTVAEYVHKVMAEHYISGSTKIFPMIFYLRTLSQFESEEKFLAHQIRLACSHAPLDLLDQMKRRGPILAVLDGFDEVASNSNLRERDLFFSRVLRIARRCSHVLLTTRQSVFTNFRELNSLIDRVIDIQINQPQGGDYIARLGDSSIRHSQSRNAALVRKRFLGNEVSKFPAGKTAVATLRPLSREKILAFLEPYRERIADRHGKTPEDVYNILLDIYDLSDILTRPLLLSMFLTVLLDGEIDLDDPALAIGPVSLYTDYINLHLYREHEKNAFLSPEARLAFARASARAMLDKGGEMEASRSNVAEVVRQTPEIEAQLGADVLERDFEKVITDVRVCGFLQITSDDKITFAHKSFMEFFIAQSIYSKISRNERADEFSKNLNQEILLFVGGFAMISPSFWLQLHQHVSDLGGDVSEEYRVNHSVALLFADTVSTGLTFNHVSKEGVILRRRQYKDCAFTDCIFPQVVLDRVELEGCRFHALNFEGSMIKCNFISCTGDLEPPSHFSDASFQRCRLTLRDVAVVDRSKFHASAITWRSLPARLCLKDVTVDTCVFTIEANADLILERCSIQNSIFLFEQAPEMESAGTESHEEGSISDEFQGMHLQLAHCNVTNSAVIGLFVSGRKWAELLRKHLPSLSGLVFTCADIGTLESLEVIDRSSGWGRVGNLIVAHRDWAIGHPTASAELFKILSGPNSANRSFRECVAEWFAANPHLFATQG